MGRVCPWRRRARLNHGVGSRSDEVLTPLQPGSRLPIWDTGASTALSCPVVEGCPVDAAAAPSPGGCRGAERPTRPGEPSGPTPGVKLEPPQPPVGRLTVSGRRRRRRGGTTLTPASVGPGGIPLGVLGTAEPALDGDGDQAAGGPRRGRHRHGHLPGRRRERSPHHPAPKVLTATFGRPLVPRLEERHRALSVARDRILPTSAGWVPHSHKGA